MRYNGGKNGAGVWQKIICQFPPHRIYIEAFLGSAAVMRRKRPAEVNIGIELNADVSARAQVHLPSVDVVNKCALATLREWPWQFRATDEVLIYADPPYPFCVRSTAEKGIYKYEFGTDSEHEQLLELLDNLPAMVAISGYRCPLYDSMLADWRRVDYVAQTRRGPVIESLWCNYDAPQSLHDYRWLGEDKTDRQRIRRRIESFVGKLRAMPELERKAIVQACNGAAPAA